MPPQITPEVAAIIDAYPAPVRQRLVDLRRIILQTAAFAAPNSRLVETLKWGQPSYLTQNPKTGTTVRIDRDKSALGDIALFVPCSTTLVSEWRDHFPHLTYSGTRAVHFLADDPLPEAELGAMIAAAMTYHQK